MTTVITGPVQRFIHDICTRGLVWRGARREASELSAPGPDRAVSTYRRGAPPRPAGGITAIDKGVYRVYIPGMSIPHALLALLDRGPSYGLRLKEEFEAWTGEVWPLNVGQVYKTLQRLERDGLVNADGSPSAQQRYYELAPQGREELRSWLTRCGPPSAPPRDELVIKVLMALAVDGVDTSAVMQAHRRALLEQLQVFTRSKADLDVSEVAAAFVVDAQIFKLEALVRWLDLCESRVGAIGEFRLPDPPSAGTRAFAEVEPMQIGRADG